mgnify:CR=1 FL=1
MVERLLQNNFTDLNLQNKLGDTALVAASIKSHPDIVSILVKKCADLSIKNGSGDTAISVASNPQGTGASFCSFCRNF